MENRRIKIKDRRQNWIMPKVPFKDSDGATINENRRKIPCRRIEDIHVEWIDDFVIY